MYSLHIEKEYLHFSAAHFAIFSETEREPLHGHNYHVSATIEGRELENGKLIEIDKVKKELRQICDELDHKTILPQQNDYLLLFPDDDSYSITFNNKTFYLLQEDCIILPIVNTTMENLSEYISNELRSRINLNHMDYINITVQETNGQKGSFSIRQEELQQVK